MPGSHLPSLRFAAIFSQQSATIDWACDQAERAWGKILTQSAEIEFDMTTYYERTMGKGLKKRLVAFRDLVDPIELVDSKRQAIEWESQYQRKHGQSLNVARPLNIDPGYLTEAKVVLMTTKDRDHRLYLGKGIFGEVTLYFRLPGKWIDSRWTYPDYRRPEYHAFFMDCRNYLRQCLQNQGMLE